MKRFSTFFAVAVASLVLLVSCGQQVELNYDKLEAQYTELTPYWNLVFDKNAVLDEKAELAFSKHYKEARDLINYYNLAGRDVGPAGTPKDGPSNTQILWNLRNELNYASKYTNAMVNPND